MSILDFTYPAFDYLKLFSVHCVILKVFSNRRLRRVLTKGSDFLVTLKKIFLRKKLKIKFNLSKNQPMIQNWVLIEMKRLEIIQQKLRTDVLLNSLMNHFFQNTSRPNYLLIFGAAAISFAAIYLKTSRWKHSVSQTIFACKIHFFWTHWICTVRLLQNLGFLKVPSVPLFLINFKHIHFRSFIDISLWHQGKAYSTVFKYSLSYTV